MVQKTPRQGTISARVDRATLERLGRLAKLCGRSRNQLLNEAIATYLAIGEAGLLVAEDPKLASLREREAA